MNFDKELLNISQELKKDLEIKYPDISFQKLNESENGWLNKLKENSHFISGFILSNQSKVQRLFMSKPLKDILYNISNDKNVNIDILLYNVLKTVC